MPEGDSLGPVRIGAREIYDEVVALKAAVGELRGELLRQRDAQAIQLAQIADYRTQLDRRMGGYSQRLRGVERRVWAMPAASLLVLALSVAVAVIAIA